MNLTQLNVFREVMEHGSVSQAARSLGRTQPAISLSIRTLEESLGLKLFERRGRQLVPVPEAQYLLAEASEILDRLSSVARTMKSLQATEAGTLSIAAMPGPSGFLLPRFISQAMADRPDIRVSMTSRSSSQITELAATQSIDWGFADLDPAHRDSAKFDQRIFSADCYCALPRDDPRAAGRVISIRDLDGVPMGALQSSHLVTQRTAAAFDAAGAVFNRIVESQIFLPLLHFVAAGQCCAIVDPLTVVTEDQSRLMQGKVVFRPLGSTLRYDYALLTPLHRPPSQLAARIKEGWSAEVLRLLEGIGANPRVSD